MENLASLRHSAVEEGRLGKQTRHIEFDDAGFGESGIAAADDAVWVKVPDARSTASDGQATSCCSEKKPLPVFAATPNDHHARSRR